MGCFQSKTAHLASPDQQPLPADDEPKAADLTTDLQQQLDRTVPPFRQFSFAELKAATNGFSTDFIVSESGEKAPNVVYRGKLNPSSRLVAIKRFSRLSWPDPHQFMVFFFFSFKISLLSLSLIIPFF